MPLPTFHLELVEHREEVPNVRRFVFRRVDGEALSFVPGQFLMLHYDDGEPFKRSYSLSSVVEEGEGIEMVVSFVEDGRGCAVLFGMELGDRVEATGRPTALHPARGRSAALHLCGHRHGRRALSDDGAFAREEAG